MKMTCLLCLETQICLASCPYLRAISYMANSFFGFKGSMIAKSLALVKPPLPTFLSSSVILSGWFFSSQSIISGRLVDFVGEGFVTRR